MTRWKTRPPDTMLGRSLLVAEGLTITSPASSKAGMTALVSPEKAGPTTPITSPSAMTWSLTVPAWAGSPAVSNSLSTIVGPSPAALALSTASLTPSRMLIPRLALSPVRAPMNAIVTVSPWAPPPPPAEVPSSPPPQPMATRPRAPTTANSFQPIAPRVMVLLREHPPAPLAGGVGHATQGVRACAGRRSPGRGGRGQTGLVDASAVPHLLDALRAELHRLERVVVAFSGGADSALLAWMAHDTLAEGAALAVTAVSPSLAADEELDCAALAAEWGLRWRPVATDELADPAYVANDGQRCARCKTALMAVLAPMAEAEEATVVLGVNLDDLGDHRPGQAVAAASGAAFPLVDAGFTKADVRAASRVLGLRTWDKPAAACLASRVPYGTPVTLGVLTEVAAAESALRRLGFRELRVRHYGDLARVELPVADFEAALSRRSEVVAAVRSAGYRYVTLDLDGLRSGNLNAALGLGRA